jgi:hypothetical protein
MRRKKGTLIPNRSQGLLVRAIKEGVQRGYELGLNTYNQDIVYKDQDVLFAIAKLMKLQGRIEQVTVNAKGMPKDWLRYQLAQLSEAFGKAALEFRNAVLIKRVPEQDHIIDLLQQWASKIQDGTMQALKSDDTSLLQQLCEQDEINQLFIRYVASRPMGGRPDGMEAHRLLVGRNGLELRRQGMTIPEISKCLLELYSEPGDEETAELRAEALHWLTHYDDGRVKDPRRRQKDISEVIRLAQNELSGKTPFLGQVPVAGELKPG